MNMSDITSNSPRLNRAMVAYNRGDLIKDYNNAAKYFKSIIRINPDHPDTHHNLITTYLELNKFKEAKKECDILFMLDRDLYYSNSFCSK